MKDSARPILLDLVRLPEDSTALDRTRLEDIAKAAAVVLERLHGPQARDAAQVKTGDDETTAEIQRPAIDDTVRAAWNDPDEATEWGAVALAISVARRVLGWEVVLRLPKYTGADFLMREPGAPAGDGDERLECSGLAAGRETLAHRMKDKLAQLGRPSDQPPGRAVVTDFRSRPIGIMIGRYP